MDWKNDSRTSASSVFLTRGGFGIRRGVTFGIDEMNRPPPIPTTLTMPPPVPAKAVFPAKTVASIVSALALCVSITCFLFPTGLLFFATALLILLLLGMTGYFIVTVPRQWKTHRLKSLYPAAICGLAFVLINHTKNTALNDLRLDDPDITVADARALIQSYRTTTTPDEGGRFIYPEDLPHSLRIKPLQYAVVFSNHVNLAKLRSPDGSFGIRIWSEDDSTPYKGKPTKYTNIYHYDWNNDYPVSPSNHP